MSKIQEPSIYWFVRYDLVNYYIFYIRKTIKIFEPDFSYIDLLFTDQNCKPLEI